jgi:hypothetical protein
VHPQNRGDSRPAYHHDIGVRGTRKNPPLVLGGNSRQLIFFKWNMDGQIAFRVQAILKLNQGHLSTPSA